MSNYIKKYSYKGYKIRETKEGTFDVLKPNIGLISENLSSIDDAKACVNSETALEENEGAAGFSGGGGAAFGGGSGSATYDAPAFGKASSHVRKMPPYSISINEEEIKQNIIRPIVEQYLKNYLL